MSARICIVDYGVGNRRSVEKALAKVGAEPIISRDSGLIADADGIVIPGVGAFPSGIARIKALGLDVAIKQAAAAGTPILGACLGMQMLFDSSDEHGGAVGLGLIAGEVRKLDSVGAKLPHIGWSDVEWTAPSPLSAGLCEAASFYHVHSYAVTAASPDVVIGWSEYGTRFASVVAQGNVFGVQFHPEKSSTAGLQLLANFASLCAAGSR